VETTAFSALLAAVVVACAPAHPRPVAPRPVPSAADCSAISWIRQIGSELQLSVVGLAATSDGGAVAIAESSAKGWIDANGKRLVELSTDGESNGFVIRLGREGQVMWTRRIGALQARVHAQGVVVRPNGSIVVGGAYVGAPVIAGGATEARLPAVPGGLVAPERLFLSYFGADGKVERIVTSNQPGVAYRVEALAASGDDVFATGTFATELSFGSGQHAMSLVPVGEEDGYVIRFDEMGDPVWGRKLGGLGSDWPKALAATKGGSVLVAGHFTKNAGYPPNPAAERGLSFNGTDQVLGWQAGKRDIFLAELNRDGGLAWWEAIGAKENIQVTGWEEVRGLVATPEGDAMLLGIAPFPLRFGSDAPLTVPGEHGGSFLARIAHGGRLRWALPLGGEGRALAALPGGDVAVSANLWQDARYPEAGPKQLVLHSAGLDDILLARHAPDGTLRWLGRFGGDDADWGGAVAADPEGALLFVARHHQGFTIERTGCPALRVRDSRGKGVASLVLRIPPDANPGDEAGEERVNERHARVKVLRSEAADAIRARDFATGCPKYQEVLKLQPDDPSAWVDVGRCLQPAKPAVTLFETAIRLASRHESYILEEFENARRDAYLALAERGRVIPLPESGCAELPPADQCQRKLHVCMGSSHNGGTIVARVGVSREHATIEEGADLEARMPSLDPWNSDGISNWHNWSQRADAMDLLVENQDSKCQLVTADACLGLVGVVCHTESEGQPESVTADEFYFWRQTE